jgi:pimeloyl-ACP methyl ester carboxylesterase
MHRFESARYTQFVPKGLKLIKGVLIHQHGCTMEGTGIQVATDVQYQAFAKKWGLALLCPDIYPHGKNCFEWNNPQNGSESSLFAGLDRLAAISKHPELINAPWLLWGHSGGGHWSLSMLRKHYNRIIALVAYSAAFDSTFNYPPTAAKVPVLLRHAGDGDLTASWAKCPLTAIHNFERLRRLNGYASIAHNLKQTHNLSYIRYMAIPFFEAVLAQRLPLNGGFILRDMDENKAWLGDTIPNAGGRIYKASSFTGNKLVMSWLPDSTSAAKYLEYINTGTVSDHTPPPAPFHCTIKSTKTKDIEILWEADADIESGIKYFNIYKNGKLLNRYPNDFDFQYFNTNGDNPILPLAPDLRYLIRSSKGYLKSDIYKVSMVNHAGLESEQTLAK